ncbi:hypothetical protein MKJ04_17700 [Pontibacter sp. E15-1]|uniref:hypothetical protein n=1 Tax=Pontibacter sp. E15-1 TaxID=2919918 RepID=UPI001F4FB4E2|nr:hypothetical protein [Pontibacter sp. E15-1]MCJ8166685.1 hypothetical protein [Pontibacter sp. E15-1]
MEWTKLDTLDIIFMAIIGIYTLILVFILTWLYHDAEQRGFNGMIIVAMAFFTGIVFGTLIWLAVRPTLKPQPIPVRS